MRASIKNYLEAAKRREEDGEKGFSLIELIIVVVILGILVAIAVPIFFNIQDTAAQNAVDAAAANGATAVAAKLANPDDTATVEAAAASGGTPGKITVTPVTGKNTEVSNVCVNATDGDGHAAVAGPGCTGVSATP
ncbi:type II secretion system protein [Microbacterium sp. B35-30]|uniref:type II secretion system protein n=1 Tax=Microbacterium sp. B35-30 TaxID=1962642 RepID=UPI0013D75116|nr:type II secretion system protein [Microbacterium sp. B35-30]KAF2416372.1 hypothetical protein B2K11_16355 [Microbacterium sp. B35-30]